MARHPWFMTTRLMDISLNLFYRLDSLVLFSFLILHFLSSILEAHLALFLITNSVMRSKPNLNTGQVLAFFKDFPPLWLFILTHIYIIYDYLFGNPSRFQPFKKDFTMRDFLISIETMTFSNYVKYKLLRQ